MLDTRTKRDLSALAEECLFVFKVLHREFREKDFGLKPANRELIAGELAAGIMAGRSVKSAEGDHGR